MIRATRATAFLVAGATAVLGFGPVIPAGAAPAEREARTPPGTRSVR